MASERTVSTQIWALYQKLRQKESCFLQGLRDEVEGGREREILSGEEREGKERELGQREKQTEKLRKEATLNIILDKTGLIDNSGNVIRLPGCNLKCVLENDFLNVYIVVFYASRWEKEYQRIQKDQSLTFMSNYDSGLTLAHRTLLCKLETDRCSHPPQHVA